MSIPLQIQPGLNSYSICNFGISELTHFTFFILTVLDSTGNLGRHCDFNGRLYWRQRVLHKEKSTQGGQDKVIVEGGNRA